MGRARTSRPPGLRAAGPPGYDASAWYRSSNLYDLRPVGRGSCCCLVSILLCDTWAHSRGGEKDVVVQRLGQWTQTLDQRSQVRFSPVKLPLAPILLRRYACQPMGGM